MSAQKPRVGILIFDDVEVLDFCGPFEVFASAAQADTVTGERGYLLEVFTVAERQETVTARGGLLVNPHYSIENHPPIDILVVPGGWGTRREMTNTRLLDWIAAQSSTADLTTSVCTGAFLLAERGLLDGKSATTHWGSIVRLREGYPEIEVQENVRFVDQGKVVTSAGVSAGIDMALHIVGRLFGEEVARDTARGMEYKHRLS